LAPNYLGPRSAKREGNQAGAQQNNTCNCHSKETVGSEFFTHGTPLTARDHWSPFGTSRPDGQNDRLRHTVKRIPVDAAGFVRVDDFAQHPSGGAAFDRGFSQSGDRSVRRKQIKSMI
jgi:hypothetical protein